MPVWDDEPPRDASWPRPDAEHAVRRVVDSAGRVKAHGDVHLAAERDAAEIIARARRDIRRIVTEARHELLELSAQLQAAQVNVPDEVVPEPDPVPDLVPDPLPDPLPEPVVLRAAEAPATVGASVWADFVRDDAAASIPEPDPETEFLVSDETPPPMLASPTSSARMFVALFTLAGVVVVAGTFLWLARRQSTTAAETPAATQAQKASSRSEPAPVSEPAPTPAPAAPAAAGLSLSLEAARPTWVRVIVDGGSDPGHIFAAGEKRQIAGATEILVRVGDAGGLLVSADGAPAAPFGPDGLSLTRRFSRNPKPAPPAEPAPAAVEAPTRPQPPAAPRPAPLPAPPLGSGPPVTVAAVPPAPPLAAPPATPVPPAPVAPARGGAPARVDVAASGRQWLDAYHRQDRAVIEALAAPSLMVTDERRPNERFPFGLEVTRAFEDEQLMLSGDSAQFTARMTERASTGAFVSRVTQTWVRRLGEWHLQDARIVHESPAAVPPP